MKTTSNEDASAGGLAGIFLLFILVSIFIIFLAPVVDGINGANNNLIGLPGLPMSQERLSVMAILCTIAFPSIGILVVLAAGINYWIVSIQDQSGDV